MKCAALKVDVCKSGRGVTPRFIDPIRRLSFHDRSGERMTWLPRRRPTKPLTSFLYTFASFAIVLSVTGAINTTLAADNPKSTNAISPQTDELDIPGSFKDLSSAKDPVTAKRSPETIAAGVANNAGSIALEIDAAKAAASGGARIASGGARIERAAVSGSAKIERAAASGGAKPVVDIFADSDLVEFNATAYCLKGRTASGVDARPGMIAADPRVLPLGTVVHLRSGSYTGTYKVMDTGGRIKGRRVDVYVATHREAVQFGRRQVKIKVLGHNSAKADRASKSLVASEQ